MSLALLLSLGGWQWRRGVEKAALVEAAARGTVTLERAPVEWSALAHRRVRLRGGWVVGREFHLANRRHMGRGGVEVLSVFRLDGGRMLLVNRGWVEAAVAGVSLAAGAPSPPPPVGEVRGRLYLPEKGFTLGAAHRPHRGWPKVIQYLDRPAISALLGAPLAPAVVVLDADSPAALTHIWRAIPLPPARHFGYAVQWWALALTLLVFGVIWRRRGR